MFSPLPTIKLRTVSVPASEMLLIIVNPPEVNEATQDTLLPLFLHVKKKATFNHDGKCYKGCLGHKGGMSRLSYKRQPNSKNEE